jgi:hypothetical protein
VGFFDRKQKLREHRFWRVPPFSSREPEVLYQHGIRCISNRDGPGAMSVGWAIWNLSALDQHQAWDFLTDGYRDWQGSSAYDRVLGVEFLEDLFDRLADAPPAPWPDLYAVPPEIVKPVATLHGALCWTASELVESDEGAAWERRAYDAIASARAEFVPPRSMSFARSFASANGLREPWT